ncbi:hypothetical protein SAMN05443245_4074 [Paraburkholderia fungorum]|uniref:Uncharacterized protein n=1 Tax=Paraburkholderia fungorum TaxID=134537 RepID=A0A1H1HME2_9BURK|nr:hypothetical protein [Paraburkholderia fungorum]SDR26592.1 hypothetical protein SAMN05443245_4074 [Paraburkholderia fungorum]
MKVLKIALIACSLSAAVAHAQSAPVAQEEQVAQAGVPRANSVNSVNRLNARSRVDVPKSKAEECVGPVSFCNIYFGS